VLGVRLTEDQQEVLRHLHIPPFKVLCSSANDVGKSYAAACAVNYWYDVYDPGCVISTAPRKEHVQNVLWTEVRLQRMNAKVKLPMPFIGPAAPEMRDGPDHFAMGFTAAKGEAFHGRHRRRMLFVIDEATAIEPIFWAGLKSMFDPADGHAILALYNPLNSTSQVFVEENLNDVDGRPSWHLFQLSALRHPNVLSQLNGGPILIKGAVNLEMVTARIAEYGCERVTPDEVKEGDFQWPPPCPACPEGGPWYRPTPEFQARVLGRWPDSGMGVWSPALFDSCLELPLPPFPPAELPQIGADMATGCADDFHAIHARWGSVSLHHETANTMHGGRVAARLRQVAQEMADLVNRHRPRTAAPVSPKDICIKVDDDGTGRTVCGLLRDDGYSVVSIGAGRSAIKSKLYPRRRHELWFDGAELAKRGGVRLAGLDRDTLRRLKQQLTAPTWQLDARGMRVVEEKQETKKRIGRSPDDADALLLAYADGAVFDAPRLSPGPGHEQGTLPQQTAGGTPVATTGGTPRPISGPGEVTNQNVPGPYRRGLFGLGGGPGMGNWQRRGLFGWGQ
jgi:hypothetical protein